VFVSVANEEVMGQQQERLRVHEGVAALATYSRQQVYQWHTDGFRASGVPELGELIRLEVTNPTIWIVTDGTTPRQLADTLRGELRPNLDGEVITVDVDTPCGPVRSSSAVPSSSR
jgi:hypothetical protein